MIIDFHVHTSPLSRCAVSDAESVVNAAIDRGLDAIVLTEHHLVHPESEIAGLQRRFPGIFIFQGIEVSTPEGEDLLVFGVNDFTGLQKKQPVASVMAHVRREDGSVVLAHPLRYSDTIAEALYHDPPDACETWSMNVYSYQREAIRTYANQTGCGLTASTDTHHESSLGAYAVRFHGTLKTEKDLAAALRQGAFTPLYDPVRLTGLDHVLEQRENVVRQRIKAGLDTQAIHKEIGGALSFIDSIRKGFSPRMMTRDEASGDLIEGLRPIPGIEIEEG